LRHIASRLRAVCAIAGLISVALLASGGPASAALPPVTCLVGLCPKPGADAPQVPSEGLVHLFAPDGVWNKPLANDARLAPDSAGLVHALASAVQHSGPWINTSRYSVPVYVVAADQAPVRVTVNGFFSPGDRGYRLQQDFASVPLPSNARPADGSDAQLVVYQPSTGTLWDFWRLQKNLLGGWTAGWGGKLVGVSTNAGIMPPGYGATATGLPLLGGLMTIDELRSGHIDHALALSMPDTRADTFVWPAQSTDGRGGAGTVPEGTRFRLPANLDIDALGLPPLTAMIAKAVQRYGAIVRDRAGSVTLYGQDPMPWTTTGYADPYAPIFAGQYPSQILAPFPWDRLEAVAPPS
jgi:hypothetical protein